VIGGTRKVTGGSCTVDGGTLTVAGSTRPIDGSTLMVGHNTQMRDDQHRLSSAVASASQFRSHEDKQHPHDF
jgi:hypothetical protein